MCFVTPMADAQEPDDNGSELVSPELPEHAVWRIGEFGDTPKAVGINRVAFSHDGQLLATRNRDNLVSIYDVDRRKKLCEVSGHDNNWIQSIDFSPDAKYFVTAAGSSEKLKIWNSQTGKLVDQVDTDAHSAYFSDDGTQLIVLGVSHVERYSWPGVQPISKLKWHEPTSQRAGMSRDGNLVVAYRTSNRRIYQSFVVDLANKSKIELDGAIAIPKAVAISPNNLWVAASYHRDPKIHLWDLRNPHKSRYELKQHKETVQSLAFSPDNRLLISSSWDDTAIAWDLLTRQEVHQFLGHTENVNATAVSPLNLTFATGASGLTDTSAIIWDLKPTLFPNRKAYERASFNQLWNGLGASFVKTSLGATARLVESHPGYLPALADRIEKEVGRRATSDEVAAAIDRLDSREFAIREQATERLMDLRVQAERQLRDVLAQTISAETRYRITRILQQPIERPKVNFTDLRRWHRIVMALEAIDTPQANELLSKIAGGHPDVDVCNDARASVERNEQRARLQERN